MSIYKLLKILFRLILAEAFVTGISNYFKLSKSVEYMLENLFNNITAINYSSYITWGMIGLCGLLITTLWEKLIINQGILSKKSHQFLKNIKKLIGYIIHKISLHFSHQKATIAPIEETTIDGLIVNEPGFISLSEALIQLKNTEIFFRIKDLIKWDDLSRYDTCYEIDNEQKYYKMELIKSLLSNELSLYGYRILIDKKSGFQEIPIKDILFTPNGEYKISFYSNEVICHYEYPIPCKLLYTNLVIKTEQ
jgi:hypothetical protein